MIYDIPRWEFMTLSLRVASRFVPPQIDVGQCAAMQYNTYSIMQYNASVLPQLVVIMMGGGKVALQEVGASRKFSRLGSSQKRSWCARHSSLGEDFASASDGGGSPVSARVATIVVT